MSSTLTVNGTAYNQAARRTANFLVDGWGWDLDTGYWLEFHEHTAGTQPQIAGPVPVSLSVGGTTVFAGDLVGRLSGDRRAWPNLGLSLPGARVPGQLDSRHRGRRLGRHQIQRQSPGPGQLHPVIRGPVGRANTVLLPHPALDRAHRGGHLDRLHDDIRTGRIDARTDLRSRCGRRAVVAGDVPGLPALGQEHPARHHGRGLVQFVNITTGTAHTLTQGTDPIDPVMISRNWTTSATKVTAQVPASSSRAISRRSSSAGSRR